MAKFVLIYSGGAMEQSEAEQAAVMQAWMNWFGTLGNAVVDAGNPFAPGAKTLKGNGVVADGAVGEPATGYTILSADSMDAAVKLAGGCPALRGGQVTVYEIFPAM